MYEITCNFPLHADLFAQAIHPKEPIIAVGLSSGHVESYKLPPLDPEFQAPGSPTRGCGLVESIWKTKRHKTSCRTLCYSTDGEVLYTAGADGIIKAANSETGKVTAKAIIPQRKKTHEDDPACIIHTLSPQTLLLGTDSAALHVYDLRDFSNSTPQASYKPHEDFIAAITPIPATDASTSGFSKQWVSVGGTTLAVTDLRKGIIAQSADQEEELTSCAFVDGFSKKGSNVGSKVIVGDGSGVLTLWEKGVWDDQDERIVLDRGLHDSPGESVDCLANVPADVAGNGKTLVAGMGAGIIACISLGQNKVIDVFQHDEIEAVTSIGFDVGNRMISGGGTVVKVWSEKLVLDEEEEETNGNGIHKRDANGVVSDDDEDEDDSDDDSDSDEPAAKKPRKKRRKGGQNPIRTPHRPLGLFTGLD